MATRSECELARKTHEQDLLGKKNVVGIGSEPASRFSADEPGSDYVVTVLVEKKVSSDELEANDVIPPRLETVGEQKTVVVPTRVIEVGKIRFDP